MEPDEWAGVGGALDLSWASIGRPLRLLASLGVVYAQATLAEVLLQGATTEADADDAEAARVEGLSWLRVAAGRENPSAVLQLAKILEAGSFGEARDAAKAARLFAQAARLGCPEAQERCGAKKRGRGHMWNYSSATPRSSRLRTNGADDMAVEESKVSIGEEEDSDSASFWKFGPAPLALDASFF